MRHFSYDTAFDDGVLAALRGEECPGADVPTRKGYAYGLELLEARRRRIAMQVAA